MLGLLLLSDFKVLPVAGVQGRGQVYNCTVETGILFWINLILDQQQVLLPPYGLSSWSYSIAEKYKESLEGQSAVVWI